MGCRETGATQSLTTESPPGVLVEVVALAGLTGVRVQMGPVEGSLTESPSGWSILLTLPLTMPRPGCGNLRFSRVVWTKGTDT